MSCKTNTKIVQIAGQTVDFSNLTAAQQLALCTTILANCPIGTSLQLNPDGVTLELVDGAGNVLDGQNLGITVNAGTTAAVGDDALGTSLIGPGDTIHFWSPDGSVQFTVAQGSSVIGATINPAVLTGIAHTAITGIDLKPTANPNEFTVEITWTDEDGVSQTTTDPTPIVIAGGAGVQSVTGEHVDNSDPLNPVVRTFLGEKCYGSEPVLGDALSEQIVVSNLDTPSPTFPGAISNEQVLDFDNIIALSDREAGIGGAGVQVNSLTVIVQNPSGFSGFLRWNIAGVGLSTNVEPIPANMPPTEITFNFAPTTSQPGNTVNPGSTSGLGSNPLFPVNSDGTGGTNNNIRTNLDFASAPDATSPQIGIGATGMLVKVDFNAAPAVKHTVHEYTDNTLYEIDGGTVTPLASIPAEWVELTHVQCVDHISSDVGQNLYIGTDGKLATLVSGAKVCYREIVDTPLAGSLFSESNYDGGPPSQDNITLGTSQVFFNPDRQVFFNLNSLPFGARIKAVRMHDIRRGNNTAQPSFSYNGATTTGPNPSAHGNGFSAALVEHTFATSQLLTAVETAWTGTETNGFLTVTPGGTNGHAVTYGFDWTNAAFVEAVQDAIGQAALAGAGITYDDVANSISAAIGNITFGDGLNFNSGTNTVSVQYSADAGNLAKAGTDGHVLVDPADITALATVDVCDAFGVHMFDAFA